MKVKKFKFKKNYKWDGDEEIVHYIEENLLNEPLRENNYFPLVKDNIEVIIIINKK